MTETKKQELLTFFVISLALVSCSVLVYMSRNPSVVGNVVLTQKTSAITLVSVSILSALASIIGAISTIHLLHKEKEAHKRAMQHNKSLLFEHPNMKIVRFVMDARRQGFKDSQIIKKLQMEGWKSDIIKKYL